MFFVYAVQNLNPRLGVRKGDRQAISVYDRNIGNRRDIVTTPAAAEEFISDRNKTLKRANNICNWLLAGGIIYTIGGVIYALKLPIFNAHHKYFGSHEIFHLFVMAGSICHFIMMFKYVAIMPIL